MRASALTGVAAALTALAVVLSGCGSDTKTATETSSEKSSSSKTTEKKSSESKTPTETSEAPAAGLTVADYLNENGGAEVVEPGQDGAPNVVLPFPEGWEEIPSDGLVEGSYGGIQYVGPEVTDVQPKIFASLQRVSPDVDPALVLEYAPNELLGLPEYEPAADGRKSELAGFDAYQLAGVYSESGRPTLIAQKTVVIPGSDTLYILQLNGASSPDQQPILGAGLDEIDLSTTITP